MAASFQGSPLLIGGDFNVTLKMTDRPNDKRRRDPNSGGFLGNRIRGSLIEMRPMDSIYTSRNMTKRNMLFKLD